MRICFLASASSRHSYRWIKYFFDIGHEISWISLSPQLSGMPTIKNMDFYEIGALPGKIFKITEAFMRIGKLIDKIKPDILHAHYAGSYGLLGALTGFHPFIVTAWGSDIFIGFKSSIKYPLIKFVLRKADLVTCGAECLVDIIEQNGISRNKIKLMHYGVETDTFTPAANRDSIRKRLGMPNSPVIISTRSFARVHGIETIIRCIPFVLKEFSEAMFIIAGDGQQDKYLKTLAARFKVLDNIRFIGRYSQKTIVDYLNVSDIYVSTSLSDGGISASTSEAMACGLPVIITDIADNKKWVKDGEGGFTIPVKSPKILAEKIIYLIKNKNERIVFGRINRMLMEEKNNYIKEMGKMEKVYRDLLANYK